MSAATPQPKPVVSQGDRVKAYRWKPGQSGNPAGRPRRASFEACVATLLDERIGHVVINEDGTQSAASITKREVIAARFVEELIAGNRDAMREFLARVWPTDQAKAVAGMFQTWTDLVQEHDTEQLEAGDEQPVIEAEVTE